MTTAREKADGWCYDWTKADGSLTRKKAAGDLIEIIQQVFAELREKENLCPGPKHSSSSPSSSAAQPASGSSSTSSETDWEPTEEQIDVSADHLQGEWIRAKVRGALIAGHRIAKGECKCSQEQSPVSSPLHFGITSATAVATKPDAPTESGTPSPKSGASSLDERAEAIFAENPEWRPRYGYQTLHLISGMDAWRWVDVPIGMSRGFVLQPDRNAHLLSALLPRAIEKWAKEARAPLAPNLSYVAREAPPRDLESAISILENP